MRVLIERDEPRFRLFEQDSYGQDVCGRSDPDHTIGAAGTAAMTRDE
jgi:hypothetical protein